MTSECLPTGSVTTKGKRARQVSTDLYFLLVRIRLHIITKSILNDLVGLESGLIEILHSFVNCASLLEVNAEHKSDFSF